MQGVSRAKISSVIRVDPVLVCGVTLLTEEILYSLDGKRALVEACRDLLSLVEDDATMLGSNDSGALIFPGSSG